MASAFFCVIEHLKSYKNYHPVLTAPVIPAFGRFWGRRMQTSSMPPAREVKGGCAPENWMGIWDVMAKVDFTDRCLLLTMQPPRTGDFLSCGLPPDREPHLSLWSGASSVLLSVSWEAGLNTVIPKYTQKGLIPPRSRCRAPSQRKIGKEVRGALMRKEGHAGKWSSVWAQAGSQQHTASAAPASPVANSSWKALAVTAAPILILLGFNQAFLWRAAKIQLWISQSNQMRMRHHRHKIVFKWKWYF